MYYTFTDCVAVRLFPQVPINHLFRENDWLVEATKQYDQHSVFIEQNTTFA